jgi:hypothetical protein
LQTTETRVYAITFAGNIGQGTVNAAVKGGPGFETVAVPGPSCVTAAVSIQKYVSVDGLTWQDANAAPGPQAALDAEVRFRFVVTNTGLVPLSGIVLADSVFDTSACAIPESLGPETFFECIIGPLPVSEGQHGNTASVSASYETITVSASDDAFYFGGELPQISIDKTLSVNGGDWVDTLVLDDDDDENDDTSDFEVRFRFVVSNPGSVPLANLTLSDSRYDVSSCSLPEALAPAGSFECIIGPFPADRGQHTNIATATGAFGGLTASASDSASYTVAGDDDDQPVIIVIEGPVQSININIITIYNINIEVDIDDPILTVIQIGDRIRVEGTYAGGGPTIVIVAINIIIINVDIVIIDGNPVVWRDDGSCANPPPAWAPAVGWRRRCESSGRGNPPAQPGRPGSGRSSRSSRSS